jgi:hypothetical protein
MKKKVKRIEKNIAPIKNTVGGGFDFEEKVAAYFLACFLAFRPPLEPESGTLERLDFQVRSHGWLLDDLLLTLRNSDGLSRVAFSIKSNPQFGKHTAPQDFVESAWLEYLATSDTQFDSARDLLGLIVSPTDTVLKSNLDELNGLAKAQDSGVLEASMNKKGFLSKSHRDLFASFACPQSVLTQEQIGVRPPTGDLLRVLRFLEFDFESVISQREREATGYCQMALHSENPEEAHRLWESLLGLVRQYRLPGGYIDRARLVNGLRHQYKLKANPELRHTGFTTLEDFFTPFLDKTKLFRHDWTLVGREDILQKLESVLADSAVKITILEGSGGNGKTRLLYALGEMLSQNQPDLEVIIARDTIPFTRENLELLVGTTPRLLVMDDVHHRDHLDVLFNFARHHESQIKLLLSTRPQATDRLMNQLSKQGFNLSQLRRIEMPLGLSSDEAETLARQSLGTPNTDLARRLVMASSRTPLVIVVGGQLLAQKGIDLELLEREEDFRHSVLSRFTDTLLGEIDPRFPSTTCRQLLKLIAAIMPIRTDNKEFLNSVAQYLELSVADLQKMLELFERAGILLRRGYTLRIMPDVLADHILYDACFVGQRETTGFARTIFEKFGSICPEPLLRNLAELDWRVSRSYGEETNLLQGIWDDITREFREGANSVRCHILGILKEVAYYQPERTLLLIEEAMRRPSTAEENPKYAQFYGHQRVLEHLPPLLRNVAYTIDYLPTCVELLWKLGQNDPSTPNSHTECAMRILADLASYDSGKPFSYNFAIFETLEQMFKRADVHEHRNSLLDVIDPLLAKEGHSTTSRGHNFVLNSFSVPIQGVKHIRKRIFQLLNDIAKGSSLRLQLRVFETFSKALSSMRGVAGLKITPEMQASWQSDEQLVLKHIAEFSQDADPVIAFKLRPKLNWFIYRSKNTKSQKLAHDIVANLPSRSDASLTAVLMMNSHVKDNDPPSIGEDPIESYNRKDLENQEFIIETAKILLKQYLNPRELWDFINEEADRLQAGDVELSAGSLLYQFAFQQTQMATELCNLAIQNPQSILSSHFNFLLFGLKVTEPIRSFEIARRAASTGNVVLCRCVATMFSWNHLNESFVSDEIDIMHLLGKHPDTRVRAKILAGARVLGRSQPDRAISLAFEIELAGEVELAEEFALLFDDQFGIPINTVSDAALIRALENLIPVRNLEDYHVQKFLAGITNRLPVAVVEMLVARIELEDGSIEAGYRPLPISGFSDYPLTGLVGSEQLKILRFLRDRIMQTKSIIKYHLKDLYWEVSHDSSNVGIDILEEWINSGDSKKLETIGTLLGKASNHFLFEKVDFVTKLLENSFDIGQECYEKIRSRLFCAAWTGERHGNAGEPFAEDVALRDNAHRVLEQLTRGTRTYSFYKDLEDGTIREIKNHLARDEELFVD